jgi:hypothetical protein
MNRFEVSEVRKIAVVVMDAAIRRACYFLSTRDSCASEADKLRGVPGRDVCARLTEALMLELGHATMADANDPNSEIARAVRKRR